MSKLIKKNWYKEFFNKYYLLFLDHKKTPLNTKREVKFICQVLNLPKKSKILDLACGTGRHAIALAKKGFNVTCLDFNKKFLDLVKKSAKQNKVSLTLVQADMRNIPYTNEFDGVINMFTSFGYFEKERENLKVLKAVSKALKPSGFFLLDLPNKNWVLTKVTKKTWQEKNNVYILEERSFNKRKNIYLNKFTIIIPKKEIKHIDMLLRLYELSELKKKLEKTNFKILKIFGDYNLNKFSEKFSPRMIILAKKVK